MNVLDVSNATNNSMTKFNHSDAVFGWGLVFCKIVVTLNDVGGSFNLSKYHCRGCLNNPIFLILELFTAC